MLMVFIPEKQEKLTWTPFHTLAVDKVRFSLYARKARGLPSQRRVENLVEFHKLGDRRRFRQGEIAKVRSESF